MTQFETLIIPISRVNSWLTEIGYPLDAIMIMGSGRTIYCDEAVAIVLAGQIISVATIAPQGEDTDIPTIVGLYTHQGFRNKGVGKAAFVAAIARCRERGFPRVHLDSMSRHIMGFIRSLPVNDQRYLDVNDMGDVMSLIR